MDDAAVAVAPFAGQVPACVLAFVERHAQRRQPLDRRGGAFDDELHGLAPVQPGAGDDRVLDMAFERVARLQDGGDPALGPGRRTRRKAALGEHRDL